MPNCLAFWQQQANTLLTSLDAARLQAPPGQREWARDLDSQPAFDILRTVRDALEPALGQPVGPPPNARNQPGNIASGTILADAQAFLAALPQDESSGSHTPGFNWLSTPSPTVSTRPRGFPQLPAPDPSHTPIPLANAITLADDLLRTVRDAIEP